MSIGPDNSRDAGPEAKDGGCGNTARLPMDRRLVVVAHFLALVADPRPDTIPTGGLYWYGLWCGYGPRFASDDATFETMKASGALQLFDYGDVGRYVAQYYQSVSSTRELIAKDEVIYARARELHAKIFDFHVNSTANDIAQANRVSFSQARIDAFVRTRPRLLSRDPALMSAGASPGPAAGPPGRWRLRPPPPPSRVGGPARAEAPPRHAHPQRSQGRHDFVAIDIRRGFAADADVDAV